MHWIYLAFLPLNLWSLSILFENCLWSTYASMTHAYCQCDSVAITMLFGGSFYWFIDSSLKKTSCYMNYCCCGSFEWMKMRQVQLSWKVEARHPAWFSVSIFLLLVASHVGLVVFSPARWQWPVQRSLTEKCPWFASTRSHRTGKL